MAKGRRIINTDEEIKIFADPYRMKIIETFIEQKKPLTVKAVADILGEVPAKVHYHVKKLLSIDVLELDHIEVIHGINAKYYKLVHDSYRINVNKNDNFDLLSRQVQEISKLVFNQIDAFKNDFIERANQVQSKEDNYENDGFITGNKIYMDDQDYLDFESMIMEFLKNHSTQEENKRKYSFFIGVIGKNESL